MTKKKKGGTQSDPVHENFLAPLKFMSAGVMDVEVIELGDRFLVFTANDDSHFNAYLVENNLDSDEPIIHHVATKIEG